MRAWDGRDSVPSLELIPLADNRDKILSEGETKGAESNLLSPSL